MASITEGLVPDPRLLAVQGAVFLVALGVTHVFFVKPLLRLNAERSRRTAGKKAEAMSAGMKAIELRKEFEVANAKALAAARLERQRALDEGRAQARQALAEAESTARGRAEEARRALEVALEKEKSRLPDIVEDVARAMLARLRESVALFIPLMIAGAGALWDGRAWAAEGGGLSWPTIGWPYVQFIFFLAVLVWAAGKVIPALLRERRSRLQEELEESRRQLDVARAELSELEGQMSRMGADAKALLEQYRVEGMQERDRIVENARRLADQIVRDADRSVVETIARQRAELRKQIVDMASEAMLKQLTPELLAELDAKLKVEALDGVKKVLTSSGQTA